jgi:hypothetical protein
MKHATVSIHGTIPAVPKIESQRHYWLPAAEHSQLHQLSQRQLGDPQNMQPDLSMPGPGPGLTNDEPLSWLFFGWCVAMQAFG